MRTITAGNSKRIDSTKCPGRHAHHRRYRRSAFESDEWEMEH